MTTAELVAAAIKDLEETTGRGTYVAADSDVVDGSLEEVVEIVVKSVLRQLNPMG